MRNESFFQLFENPLSDNLEIIVRDTCKGLALEISDLISLKVSLASLGCITELASQVLGTETGTAGIQENVVSLEQILTALSKQSTENHHIKSALHFLQQADNYLSTGNVGHAKELLKMVNGEAIRAWNISTTDMTEDLVICLKLLILVDILFESIIPANSESNTLHVTPINRLDCQQRRNISVHVASHVQTLVKKLGMTDFDKRGFMGLCTKYYGNKKAHDKYSLLQVYNDCSQWLLTETIKIDEDTFQTTLPSFTTIPDNPRNDRESTKIINMRISEQDSLEQHSLSLWTGDMKLDYDYDYYEKVLFLGFCGEICFSKAKNYKYDEDIVVTIKDKKIVSISPGSLEDHKIDLTNNYCRDWKPEYIMAMAGAVVCGDVTEVDNLLLEAADYRNFMGKTDLMKVEQIMPIVRKCFILHLTEGLEMMGVEYMRMLADKSGEMEKIMMKRPAHLEQQNWCIGHEGQGYEVEVGRLMTRAKTALLDDTRVLGDFSLFIQGIIQGLIEKGANCETMLFKKIDPEHRDKIAEWGERLGWSIEEEVYHTDDIPFFDTYCAIKVAK